MQGRWEFDWDEAKARSNLATHGVPFRYAIRVFLDPNMADFDASRGGDMEARRKAAKPIKSVMIEGKLSASPC